MNRKIIALAALLTLAAAGYAFAQGGMMGGQGGGMMGPGMMGQGGMGQGGMMGQGGGMMGGQGGMGGMMGMMRMMNECGRMMEASPASAEPVTQERAEAIVKQYLTNLRNPNLKAGKVTEETASFVVEITTKDGALVDKVIVDKRTGHARSIY